MDASQFIIIPITLNVKLYSMPLSVSFFWFILFICYSFLYLFIFLLIPHPKLGPDLFSPSVYTLSLTHVKICPYLIHKHSW